MKITTNNVPRDLLDGSELTDKDRADFDYIKDGEWYEDTYSRFFRYKGNVYDTQDSETVHYVGPHFVGWDGMFTETFFSGVLFKYVPDTDYEQVIVGRYCT